MAAKPDTCLSPKVYQILCEKGTAHADGDPACSGLDSHGFIDWDVIKNTLPDPVRPEEETYEYFVSCVTKLRPLMRCIHDFYDVLSCDQFTEYHRQYLTWISLDGAVEAAERCFSVTKADSQLGPLQAVLVVTPRLERALGDVYLLCGSQCPSMLKDLLMTKELQTMLSPTPIHMLRVLIGPPISLNLRNVAWHGFPAPGEIHSQYAYTLLCVMISLGKILKEKGITDIKHRPTVTFPQIERLQDVGFSGFQNSDIDEFIPLLHNTTFIHKSMTSIWGSAMESFKQRRYHDCVSLLLPQLEHGLRMMFAGANKCPQRVLTAENTTLFTTFDEILSSSLEDGSSNKLRSCIGDPMMTLLLDLLLYPEGPRLRDRVSHGEVTPGSVTEDVASVLVSVCLMLAVGGLPTDSPYRKIPKAEQLLELGNNYQSLFHPISIVKSKIRKCCVSLSRWRLIPRPTLQQIECGVDWNMEFSNMPENVQSTEKSYMKKFSKLLPWSPTILVLQPFSDLPQYYNSYLLHELTTLFRNNNIKERSREEEIVGFLDRILDQCQLVSEQVIEASSERFAQFERKELRSRQRKTYGRMLDSIPTISTGVRVVLVLVAVHLYSLEHLRGQSEQEYTRSVGLFKLVLKYCENLVTYTNKEKNRWEEAMSLTDSTLTRIPQYM